MDGDTHDNIKPVSTGPGNRVFELTPPQPEKCHEAGTYRGTLKY